VHAAADGATIVREAIAMPIDADMVARVRREVETLADEYQGVYSIESIQLLADEGVRRFEQAAIIEFIPLLVYKYTRQRLQALSQAEGRVPKDKPEILFVCVHNAGRSQMAAALAAHLSAGRVHVRSAGSTPADQINPAVVEAMAEMGLDLSEEFPKPLNDEFVRAADVVITMGCGDACPLYPGKKYIDWDIADPAGQPLEAVRRIRDELTARVEALLAEILTPAANHGG
jgi:protein-tyrosine-phosphatase